MDYEQKYKAALEWMRGMYGGLHGKTKEEAEKYFPELDYEYEIKAALLDILYNYPELEMMEKYGVDCSDAIKWLEKQGEQKPAAKVESKFNFKVGQWFVATGKCVYLIVKIDGFNVTLVDTNGDEYVFDVSSLDDAYEWTIQDAKDGDVLVNGSNIFIFSYLSDTRAMGYCHINLDDGRFYDDKGKNECFGLIDADFSPATKEQRDLLFAKMREEGFEWDVEKKELRKILKLSNSAKVGMDEESKWTDEDEHTLQGVIDEIQANKNQAPDYDLETYDRFLSWLNSLKQRMEE